MTVPHPVQPQVPLLVHPGAVPVQQPPPNQAPPVAPVPPRMNPVPGSALHELLGRLDAAKADEAEAKARAKTINLAIKNLVTGQFPGASVIDISGTPTTPPMRMVWVTPRKLDIDRLKTEQLDIYNHYLVWADGYWQLKKAGA